METNTPQTQTLPFQFTGKGSEYFKIWIVNICLSIVTLGIYSAWAKVRNNQYFYGNTQLSGNSFAYLANPVNILKGRLIAFFFFAIYSVAGNVYPVSAPIFSLAFIVLLPWLIIKSMSFRARNTSYRNIRFNFKARYGDVIVVFLLMPILLPLTLGLFAPYLIFRQKKFFVDHNGYGQSFFKFNAKGSVYYKPIILAVIIFIVGIGSLAALSKTMPAIMLLSFLLYIYLYAYLSASINNTVYNSAALNKHGFSSSLKTNGLFMLYITNTLGILLTAGLFIPWAKVRMANYRAKTLQLNAVGNLDSFVAAEESKVSAMGEEIGEMFDFEFGL